MTSAIERFDGKRSLVRNINTEDIKKNLKQMIHITL